MSPTWFSFSKSLTPTATANETSSGSEPSSFLSTPPPASATSAVDNGSSSSNNSDGAAAHDLSAIPYHKMWEESRVWLPHLLQNSLKPVSGTASLGSSNSDLPSSERENPAVTTTTSSSSESESSISKSQPDGNTSANNNKRYFIHHVQFVGGTDKDISAEGEYSAWHKMGNRRLDWVDELPVDEWNRKRTFAKYP
ncbi:hypothetical protein H072_6101 [Dactylellina haptotyla CBS 200.50]|uniref:Uncharacterized protein n=1 Tax=Dactylellina haptotyla (strain CBS 200.50) TaxID=1284197 RepID=S8AG04_DACHA|nr:hypothetical protein H072_6101 [Dactylellina haptotyla CBS 200.50]